MPAVILRFAFSSAAVGVALVVFSWPRAAEGSRVQGQRSRVIRRLRAPADSSRPPTEQS